MKLLSTM